MVHKVTCSNNIDYALSEPNTNFIKRSVSHLAAYLNMDNNRQYVTHRLASRHNINSNSQVQPTQQQY